MKKVNIINKKNEQFDFTYDFQLSQGIFMASDNFAIENNNTTFGSMIPVSDKPGKVAVKFTRLEEDCIATVNIEGEGTYQFIVNKKSSIALVEKSDSNTYHRFKDILEAAYKMISASYKSSTQNTSMKL